MWHTRPSGGLQQLCCLICVFLQSSLVTGSSLTDAEKAEFVKAHNDFRTNADPKPKSIMNQLVWSKTIEASAEEAAKKPGCPADHSDTKYGENISGKNSPTEAVKQWHGEKDNYDHSAKKCKKGLECGHYTQVMWGKSKEIGCSKCTTPTGGTHFWCQYDPAGNMQGETMYEYDASAAGTSAAGTSAAGTSAAGTSAAGTSTVGTSTAGYLRSAPILIALGLVMALFQLGTACLVHGRPMVDLVLLRDSCAIQILLQYHAFLFHI